MDAKTEIERIVGHPIQHFSCPGGRYDERTLRMAKESGFATVANSQFHANSSRTSPYELGRVAMLRGPAPRSVPRNMPGPRIVEKRLQHQARSAYNAFSGTAPMIVCARSCLESLTSKLLWFFEPLQHLYFTYRQTPRPAPVFTCHAGI